MTSAALRIPSLYDQLTALPESLTGEIINGQLRTQPRPGWPHALVTSRLGADLEGPYGRGRGGPGGWWIIDEPEVHFVLDLEVTVPDLAGWRRERLPVPPQGHKVTVVPDWICEVLSPATSSTDREEKMPLYARHGVRFAWLVNPRSHTLEAFMLEQGAWITLGVFGEDEKVAVPPFELVTLDLADLWC